MISKKGMTEKTGTKFENRSTDVIHFEIPPPKKKQTTRKKKRLSAVGESEKRREKIFEEIMAENTPNFFFFKKENLQIQKRIVFLEYEQYKVQSTKYNVQGRKSTKYNGKRL